MRIAVRELAPAIADSNDWTPVEEIGVESFSLDPCPMEEPVDISSSEPVYAAQLFGHVLSFEFLCMVALQSFPSGAHAGPDVSKLVILQTKDCQEADLAFLRSVANPLN